MKLRLFVLTLLRVIACFYGTEVMAETASWRASNIQFLHDNQYELGPKTRESITIEQANSWLYGESYFFTNIFNRRDVGTEFYAEFYPRITWQAVTGRPSPVEIVDDFSLVAGLNIGNLPRTDPFKAYLLGLGVKFKTSVMDNLSLSVTAFKSDNAHTTGIQVSQVWAKKFSLGQHRFWFKGFIEWQSAKATGKKATLATQPQLLLDIGHYWQKDHQIYAGIEYAFARNKYGVDGVIERVPQAMLLIPF